MKTNKIREENRDTTIILMPIVAIIGKLIQFFVLPDKYFYDSLRMQGMMNKDTTMAGWAGYKDTVEIFSKLNIFNFTSTRQWSIALGIIGTILLMIIVSRCKEMSLMESIYTLMATGLMNIYEFNLAKEPIQIFFFFCIMLIIIAPINNTLIKLVGCCFIYYWESNTFRSYYIIMAVMALLLYFIFYWLQNGKGKISKIKIIFSVVLCFCAMFAFVYASQYVDYEAYSDALSVRDDTANSQASTVIDNFVEINGNYGLFMINYVINAVRMMFPIELLVKSPVYAPFFLYQIFILSYWIRALRNIKLLNSKLQLSLTCFTAYLFGSFIFEPDFGSWVRHEAASFPVFYFMAYEDIGRIEEGRNYKSYEK